MARTGWTTAANYLRYSSAILTATPLSMSAWGYTPVTGSFQRMLGIYNSASALNFFSLCVDTTNNVEAVTTDGVNSSQALTSTAISASTWFHAGGVWASATSRAAYLNGGGKGTEATSRVPSGLDRTNIGVRDTSTIAQSWGASGASGAASLAEVGLWSIALSDSDMLALSKGLSPLKVHPEALVAYWPLLGNNSPENNLKSNTSTMAIQGTLTKSAHPRLILPKRRGFGR